MILTAIVLGSILILFTWLLWHLTCRRGYLETLGIPMDKPQGLLGSRPHDIHNHVWHKMLLGKFKKFGKTFGRYEGVIPVIETIDPELIKSVLVKNFENFPDFFSKLEDKYTTLDISGGDSWRVLRKHLSPTFTSGKLKAMLEPMVQVTDDTMDFVDKRFKESKNGEIDIKEVFQGFAINTIARCAFGIDANAHLDPEQDLIKHGALIFSSFRSTGWFITIMLQLFNYFPYLEDKIPIWPPSYDKVWEITKALIKQRTEQKIQMNDFLNRLMEMQKTLKDSPDSEDMQHISDDMIIAQGVVFFIAGYETTANTLCTTCYHLAKNPHIQERLHDEICEVIEQHNGKIDHETINDMDYLEAVINEDLRIAGPATLHLRRCLKDTEVLPGFIIKKGTRVDMPIYSSHHYDEYFPDPDEFRPERFTKENSRNIIPYTFRPFGGGPRQCIGQRFSFIEMKLGLAKLLSKYRLVATENTKLEYRQGEQFLLSYEDMKIKFEPRK